MTINTLITKYWESPKLIMGKKKKLLEEGDRVKENYTEEGGLIYFLGKPAFTEFLWIKLDPVLCPYCSTQMHELSMLIGHVRMGRDGKKYSNQVLRKRSRILMCPNCEYEIDHNDYSM